MRKWLLLVAAAILALAVVPAPPAHAQKFNGGLVTLSLTAVDPGNCSGGATSCAWMTFPANAFPYNTTAAISGTWAGTVTCQGNNGGTWTLIGTTTANATYTTWAKQYTDVRCFVAAYTSGTVVVNIGRQAIVPGESAGQITFSSATSGTHTFTNSWNVAPVCTVVLNGTSPDTTANSVAASATTTVLTITAHTSNSSTWNWQCWPAAN